MPTLEDLAAMLCQLREMKRLEYTKCLEDGTVCVPSEIPCCGEKTFSLSQGDMLSLVSAVGSDPCCPASLDLLESILEALLDDAETGNYTTVCSSADPSVTYLTWFEQPDEVGGTVSPYHLILGDNTPIPGFPPDGVRCQDHKVVEGCFYVPGDPDVYYTRILCLAESTVVATLWVDADGTILGAAPPGAVPCASEEIRSVILKQVCGELADGTYQSGFLELVYNQDGTLFSQRTTDKELITMSFVGYELGECVCLEPCF